MNYQHRSPHEDGAASVVSGSSSFASMEEGHESSSKFFHNKNSINSFGDETSDTGATSTASNNALAPPTLVQRENRWLSKARMLMLFILFLSTASMATGTFYFMKRVEKLDFTTRYNDFADQIITVSQKNAIHIFHILESMSLQMTAYVAGTSRQWPLVLFPDYNAMVQQAVEQTGAIYIGYAPLVKHQDRQAYENYTVQNQEWITKGFKYMNISESKIEVAPYIYRMDEDYEGGFVSDNNGKNVEDVHDLYAPIAQIAPMIHWNYLLNYNGFDFDFFKHVYDSMIAANRPVLSEVTNLDNYEMEFDDDYVVENPEYAWPSSFMAAPIYDKLGPNPKIVGILSAIMPWHSYFQDLIPEGIDGIHVVVKNTCDQEFTYLINGPEVLFEGPGDLHDRAYDEHEVSDSFKEFISIEDCTYSFHIYPTRELEAEYKSNRPVSFTIAIVVVFMELTIVFLVYDLLVERRQEKVMTSALRSGAIVNSLFPANVRDRLMDNALQQQNPNDGNKNNKKPGTSRFLVRDSKAVTSVLKAVNGQSASNQNLAPTAAKPSLTENPSTHSALKHASHIQVYDSKPIADLFPQATVLFGDLVGFTAWSSVREPAQVFTLLETLYNSFDKTARKLGVFKVETIGDSYMAATGLPEPRPDHAVAMVRFARHCMYQLHEVVRELDRQLGPGTADLTMRFGIHSGPVTAGVLRGEKSRFQLFGDTVNTASRMESTGTPSKIQLSQETAECLIQAGKSRWIRPREERITAKGKGELQTYWLAFRPPSSSSITSSSTPEQESNLGAPASANSNLQERDPNDSSSSHHRGTLMGPDEEPKLPSPVPLAVTNTREKSDMVLRNRLVEWNADSLERLLKKIVALRGDGPRPAAPVVDDVHWHKLRQLSHNVIDEVKDFIELPNELATYQQDPDTVELATEVSRQLRDYVEAIASMYNDNPFHSFAHACHVSQSVMKLMSRVVTPADSMAKNENGMDENDIVVEKNHVCNAKWHEYTHGIASDPLTQFACAFSALIHDVDHAGVPNAQLVKEGVEAARIYKNKSVAEQNSVDVAWELLLEDDYKDLRACIYTTQDEHDRFRQLVVNAVMATDIMDTKLNAARRKRWEDAFENVDMMDPSDHNDSSNSSSRRMKSHHELANKKATIVIEHLIQASDVAHTMQHWHVYIKWNEKLFHETYLAYLAGRSEKDPSENWYTGELGFYDYYIIPLAEQLKECGVFGVASDEYLTYAMANRKEWEVKGKDIVRGYLEKYKSTRSRIQVV